MTLNQNPAEASSAGFFYFSFQFAVAYFMPIFVKYPVLWFSSQVQQEFSAE